MELVPLKLWRASWVLGDPDAQESDLEISAVVGPCTAWEASDFEFEMAATSVVVEVLKRYPLHSREHHAVELVRSGRMELCEHEIAPLFEHLGIPVIKRPYRFLRRAEQPPRPE